MPLATIETPDRVLHAIVQHSAAISRVQESCLPSGEHLRRTSHAFITRSGAHRLPLSGDCRIPRTSEVAVTRWRDVHADVLR